MNRPKRADSLEAAVNVLPSSGDAKSRLLRFLWGARIPDDCDSTAYLEFYDEQCDSFFPAQDLEDAVGHVKTHQELADIANSLVTGARDRDDIVADLLKRKGISDAASPAGHDVKRSIDWAARALTCTEIGNLDDAYTSRKPLLWETGSLREFISGVFPPSRVHFDVRLEKAFNARNLERFAGITVEWTNDLSSHLSLRDDDTKVLLFHQATFLRNVRHDIFPPNFCEETLQTLALLLPSSDRDIQRWFHRQKGRLDSGAIKYARLRADNRQIEHFHFWRERLCILKQVFDEAEPKTLSQFWRDRRKRTQWYTFWVAIVVLALTVFFGLVQSITGILQVYKAYHPS